MACNHCPSVSCVKCSISMVLLIPIVKYINVVAVLTAILQCGLLLAAKLRCSSNKLPLVHAGASTGSLPQ